jgi:deoxyhypusine monooxygenase
MNKSEEHNQAILGFFERIL